jgi:hypothetical protein
MSKKITLEKQNISRPTVSGGGQPGVKGTIGIPSAKGVKSTIAVPSATKAMGKKPKAVVK